MNQKKVNLCKWFYHRTWWNSGWKLFFLLKITSLIEKQKIQNKVFCAANSFVRNSRKIESIFSSLSIYTYMKATPINSIRLMMKFHIKNRKFQFPFLLIMDGVFGITFFMNLEQIYLRPLAFLIILKLNLNYQRSLSSLTVKHH